MRASSILALCSVLTVTPASMAVTYRHDLQLADVRGLAAGVGYESAGQLSITNPALGNALASGVLIHPEWVLTAAHPLTSPTITAIDLSFTDRDNGAPVVASASAWIPFPGFNPFASAFNLDIGLIHLDAPLVGITPAPLFMNDGAELGEQITIVGYGQFGNGFSGGLVNSNGVPSAVTNTVDVFGGEPASPFNLSAYQASVMFMDFDPVPGTSASNPTGLGTPTAFEGLSAIGDSGGPGYIDIDGVPHVAGVVSVGLSFDGIFSGYGDLSGLTRVSAFLDWIDDYVPLGLPGDIDGDGLLTAADIDLIAAGFGSANPLLDLNSSGLVTSADVDAWLVLAGSARGDANLDLAVDLIDLSILASGFGGSADGWADADFNADGLVDLIDLSQLAMSFGVGSPTNLPEPVGVYAIVGLGFWRIQMSRG
ncbi:MAG: trypsin-like serine protease [Phycisphaeraceae bacterium]